MKRAIKKQIRETVVDYLKSMNLRDYFPRVSPEEIDNEMYEIQQLILGKKRNQRINAGIGNRNPDGPSGSDATKDEPDHLQ